MFLSLSLFERNCRRCSASFFVRLLLFQKMASTKAITMAPAAAKKKAKPQKQKQEVAAALSQETASVGRGEVEKER